MMKYEIHIGSCFDLEKKMIKPHQKLIITDCQLAIIEKFASTRKDSDLNTVYKLNDCEFTVHPHFDFDNPCFVNDRDATIGNKDVEIKT